MFRPQNSNEDQKQVINDLFMYMYEMKTQNNLTQTQGNSPGNDSTEADGTETTNAASCTFSK